MSSTNHSELYITLISIHGLIRGNNLELGCDADTGGQTKYVVELARALARLPNVRKVELITRRIVDDHVDEDYAEPIEKLSDKAQIVRIDCGPEKYIAKELLWDHLDNFADNLLDYFKRQADMPDIIHSHYADAGYVATRISHTTGIPLAHTGHSLGRDKRKRLMAAGSTSKQLETRYNITRRIEAEEVVLANASLVVTSTNNEIIEQYEPYDFYRPDTMAVIPPGTDLELFHPPELGEAPTKIGKSIRRFLDEPDKAMILALSRPDPRKNISTLVRAFGESKELQDIANLVIIAGNRDDIRKMDDGAQTVLSELLILIDYYDLYGKIAVPKKHLFDEVPAIYRMAANSRGVFVNPALTEPFGLTLLESAASGLPFIATENGGPVDIVKNCSCGILVDPLSVSDMGQALKTILLDGQAWRKFSANGITNVSKKYSWDAHAKKYSKLITPIITQHKTPSYATSIVKASRHVERLIISDLDKTLLSNTRGLKEFAEMLRSKRKETAWGVATARRLDSVLAVIKKYDLPKPDILISSLGTEIYYSQALTPSTDWADHVDHNWNPKAIRRILSTVEGLELQTDGDQSRFKISYHRASNTPELCKNEITSLLRQEDQSVNVFLSSGQNLDITPSRASKGLALRYVAHIWGIPIEQILVAGGAGTDEDMMSGNTLSVIVGNRHHEPLEKEDDTQHIYFAKQPNALGILEAIEHYKFFDSSSSKLTTNKHTESVISQEGANE